MYLYGTSDLTENRPTPEIKKNMYYSISISTVDDKKKKIK